MPKRVEIDDLAEGERAAAVSSDLLLDALRRHHPKHKPSDVVIKPRKKLKETDE